MINIVKKMNNTLKKKIDAMTSTQGEILSAVTFLRIVLYG